MLANNFDAEDLNDWGVAVWQTGESNMDMDGFFDTEEPKGDKSNELVIKIHVPKDQEEHEEDIRGYLNEIKDRYPGLKIE